MKYLLMASFLAFQLSSRAEAQEYDYGLNGQVTVVQWQSSPSHRSRMVELADRMKVLQVGEQHLDKSTGQILKICCFLTGTKNLVFENLTTGGFYAMNATTFGRRYQWLRAGE